VKDVLQFASTAYARDFRAVTGVGAFNDPDFLVVGCPTNAPCDGLAKTAPLSDVEQRTQMSMSCVLGAPLIIGSDILNLSATALHTLSNPAAIAINQDPLVARPFIVSKADEGMHQVWARPLSGGDVAVALLNLGDGAQSIGFDLINVCEACSKGAMATDVWTGKVVKITHLPQSNSDHTVNVPPHATVLLRLKGAPPTGMPGAANAVA